MYDLPIVLYRLGLGGMFGTRFLLLEHRGRRSGRVRATVLEVVRRYVRRHPRAARGVVRAVGLDLDPATPEGLRRFGAEVPLVALDPRETRGEDPAPRVG